MEESLEQAISLDSRVLKAKQSNEELKDLLKEYMPFIHSQVARYSSSTNKDKYDELQSVAMMSFCEAVKKYDADKGHFYLFVTHIVRLRLVDSLRQAYKFEEHTVPRVTVDDDPVDSSMLNSASISSYEAQRTNEFIANEIEQFAAELSTWGITIADLTKHSPKHQRMLAIYKMAIAKIAQDVNIIQTIQLKRYYPVKAISELTGLPLKNVVHARTFIIASLIIKFNDFDYLSEYIKN